MPVDFSFIPIGRERRLHGKALVGTVVLPSHFRRTATFTTMHSTVNGNINFNPFSKCPIYTSRLRSQL
jgi:hypothetical protein